MDIVEVVGFDIEQMKCQTTPLRSLYSNLSKTRFSRGRTCGVSVSTRRLRRKVAPALS
jgi:hypothetical protein